MRRRLNRPFYLMLLGPAILTSTLISTMSWPDTAAHLGSLAFPSMMLIVTWALVGWLALASGIYLDDQGVLVRDWFRARRIPWREIRTFESRPAKSAVPWMDSGYRGIWLVPKRGEPVEVGYVCRPEGRTLDQVMPRKAFVVDATTFGRKLDELNDLLTQHRQWR